MKRGVVQFDRQYITFNRFLAFVVSWFNMTDTKFLSDTDITNSLCACEVSHF